MKPLSVIAKLSVLIVFALLFGATMVALSIRTHNTSMEERFAWGANQNVEKTFAVQPGGKFVIDADAGSVSIIGTDKQEVAIRVAAHGSEKNLSRYKVDFFQEGNTIRVEGRFKQKHFMFFGDNSIDVQYDVEVPREFNLSLQTSGGNIVVQDIKGSIEGSTAGGDIDLTKLDGTVNLSTSGGNVSVQQATGDFKLETSGGNITGDNLSGNVRFETSGGNVEIRNTDGKVYASTSGGNIRATLKDNKGIDLSTSGGNVVVRLPKTIAGDVRAEASGGDVNCDFPFSGKLREGRMNAKINGGGNLIRLETSGGDIVLNSIE
ncbi:MAG: DUF4097 family beta strand repeat protein [Ignavibacteriae bacterium]|nr:DUF4097 family beta strand repeat protein [Ignavibacteriota bacterium]